MTSEQYEPHTEARGYWEDDDFYSPLDAIRIVWGAVAGIALGFLLIIATAIFGL